MTVAHVSKHIRRKGKAAIRIVPNARGRAYLNAHGRMKVRLRISFQPTGASASVQTRTVVLHKSAHH